jgi:hypothetical protein
MIYKQEFSSEIEFAVLLIPGIIFALLPRLSRGKNNA